MTISLTAARPPLAWRAINAWRAELAAIVGLSACSILIDQFRIYNTFNFPTLTAYLLLLADASSRYVLGLPALVIGLHVALRLPFTGWRRSIAAAAVTATAAALSATISIHGLPYEAVSITVGASASATVALWYETWMRTLVCLLALVVVEQFQSRQQAVERLAERHERSLLVRRQLALAQLQAIQARVDPQLLFDTLAAVKRLYERDTARAEALLDRLTAFLRAALPRLRDARSTLAVEFGLVGCYVQMLDAAGDSALELDTTLPDELADRAFPAGLLLPLVARRPAAPRRIELTAHSDADGGLHVRLADTAAPDAAAIQRLRASLADLYGDRARLHRPDAQTIELELPLEHE